MGRRLDRPVADQHRPDEGSHRCQHERQSFRVHLGSVEAGEYALWHTNRWGLPERKSEVRLKSGAVSQL